MTMWAAGMFCVCVREFDAKPGLDDLVRPVRGVVYRVRAAGACPDGGDAVLLLEEIDNRHLIGRLVFLTNGGTSVLRGEVSFEAHHFRPLSRRRLDVFQADLAPREMEAAR